MLIFTINLIVLSNLLTINSLYLHQGKHKRYYYGNNFKKAFISAIESIHEQTYTDFINGERFSLYSGY
jgi:ribosome biogenesis protein Nip4